MSRWSSHHLRCSCVSLLTRPVGPDDPDVRLLHLVHQSCRQVYSERAGNTMNKSHRYYTLRTANYTGWQALGSARCGMWARERGAEEHLHTSPIPAGRQWAATRWGRHQVSLERLPMRREK
jgi:hypothetical protein